MAYNSVAALKTAFHPGEYLRIFDDNNDGVVADDEGPPLQVLMRAHERLNRNLVVAFGGDLPFDEGTAPDSVKVIELEYAMALARARAVDEKARREAADALEALDKEAQAMSRGFTKVLANQPSPGPALGVDGDATPSGIEEASMASRNGGDCYKSLWWRRAEREC